MLVIVHRFMVATMGRHRKKKNLITLFQKQILKNEYMTFEMIEQFVNDETTGIANQAQVKVTVVVFQ